MKHILSYMKTNIILYAAGYQYGSKDNNTILKNKTIITCWQNCNKIVGYGMMVGMMVGPIRFKGELEFLLK